MNQPLKILTFNIWDMPIWLPKIDRRKRLKKIPSEINKLSPNIICFQESFKIKNRKKIIESLTADYFSSGNNQTRKLYPLIRTDIHGGLLVLSQFPIIEKSFIE